MTAPQRQASAVFPLSQMSDNTGEYLRSSARYTLNCSPVATSGGSTDASDGFKFAGIYRE
jgi:hypothetical protein